MWEYEPDEGRRCPPDKCSLRLTNQRLRQFSPKPNRSSLLSLICRVKPTMKPDVAHPVPARPYNLDQLISDRAKAEADLDNMISEMRGRMKGR